MANPPRILGKYRVQEEIGRGGMANVYRAMDYATEQVVAIKVLPSHFLQDPTFLKRFAREARVIAALSHPRILPVIESGEENGVPYIVMPYLQGGSLSDRLHREGALPLSEVNRLVSQIAEALDYAHDHEVIHRDFKPGNVLLDEQGDAYLADFGIAKVAETTAHLTGTGIVGTPAYMAPEMATPEGLSPLIDVYAFGVTVFQMLSGELPFDAASPMGLLLAHLSQPIPDVRRLRPNLPDMVQPIIERGMAKDPFDRYPRAGQLAADLHSVLWPFIAPTTSHEVEPDLSWIEHQNEVLEDEIEELPTNYEDTPDTMRVNIPAASDDQFVEVAGYETTPIQVEPLPPELATEIEQSNSEPTGGDAAWVAEELDQPAADLVEASVVDQDEVEAPLAPSEPAHDFMPLPEAIAQLPPRERTQPSPKVSTRPLPRVPVGLRRVPVWLYGIGGVAVIGGSIFGAISLLGEQRGATADVATASPTTDVTATRVSTDASPTLVSPTDTPTSGPTPTASPTPRYTEGALLFTDDFEDGDAASWTRNTGWIVLDDGTGNFVFQTDTTDGVAKDANLGSSDWANYSLSFKMKVLNSNLTYVMTVRTRLFNFVDCPGFIMAIGQRILADDCTEYKPTHASAILDVFQWHDIRLDLFGDTLTVYADGTEAFSHLGTEGAKTGGVSFEVQKGTIVQLDDVRVTELLAR